MFREFHYNGTVFTDPDETKTPEEVKKILAGGNPALANARIEGPEEKDGTLVYTLKTEAKTKG